MPDSLAGCAVGRGESEPLARRLHREPPHAYRPPFSRDRARIIHSRAFRRLAGKTQVFTDRTSDHFRSRLTHTMEVAQIARATAAALGLNDDLAEALALVHDIGHPPFGHAGERALDEELRAHGLRFDHNLHALRTVEFFELQYAAFRGLNLTLGVREGIVKHSRDYSQAEHPQLAEYLLDQRPPLEAQLIDLADEIAYLTADLDDGVEAGMLETDDIRHHVELFSRGWRRAESAWPQAGEKLAFKEALRAMVNDLAVDLLETTRANGNLYGIRSLAGVRAAPLRLAALSAEMDELRAQAKSYLYGNLYQSPRMLAAQARGMDTIHDLFAALVRDPARLPPGYEGSLEQQGVIRTVADYIAGMTDSYILQLHASLVG